MLWFVNKAFVFAYLTTVHKFYGLKASQINKVCASSHEYPDAEEIKNLCEQNFKGHSRKRLQQLISKLNSCEKYPDSFFCFCCLKNCKNRWPILEHEARVVLLGVALFGVYL